MVKNDPEYFRSYYEKNKQRILEQRKKRYMEDKKYRKKVKTRAYFFRRLSSIIKRIEYLINEWREGRWQKWRKEI